MKKRTLFGIVLLLPALLCVLTARYEPSPWPTVTAATAAGSPHTRATSPTATQTPPPAQDTVAPAYSPTPTRTAPPAQDTVAPAASPTPTQTPQPAQDTIEPTPTRTLIPYNLDEPDGGDWPECSLFRPRCHPARKQWK